MRLAAVAFAAAMLACTDAPEETATDSESTPVASAFSSDEAVTGTGLAGTLLTPSQARTDTLAIIVPSSGPTDRNGNGPMISTDAYRMLAEALAESGVPSLRVDKRGMFGSSDAGDPNAVTLDVYRGDVAAWLEAMDRDCAVLVGHSEGGTVALHSADLPGVCGVILLTSPGRRLSDVLREQLSGPANRLVLGDTESIIAALERGERVDTTDLKPALASLFREDVQDFLISLFAVDPAEVASELAVPLMVVGGGRDVQVGRADYDALSPHADEAVWLENMAHTLKSTNLLTMQKSYRDPTVPMAPELAGAVAEFILSVD